MKSDLLKLYFLAYSDLAKIVPNTSMQQLRVVALYKLTMINVELRIFNLNLIKFLKKYSTGESETQRSRLTNKKTVKPVSVVEDIRAKATEIAQEEQKNLFNDGMGQSLQSNRQETITGMMVRAVKKGEFDPRDRDHTHKGALYNYLYTEPTTPRKAQQTTAKNEEEGLRSQDIDIPQPDFALLEIQLPVPEARKNRPKVDKTIPDEIIDQIELPVFRSNRMAIAEPEPEHIHQNLARNSLTPSVQLFVSQLEAQPEYGRIETAQFLIMPMSPKNYLIPCPKPFRYVTTEPDLERRVFAQENREV